MPWIPREIEEALFRPFLGLRYVNSSMFSHECFKAHEKSWYMNESKQSLSSGWVKQHWVEELWIQCYQLCMYIHFWLINSKKMPLKSVRMCRLTRCQVDKYGSWLHCLDGALKAAMAFRSMKMIIPFMY